MNTKIENKKIPEEAIKLLPWYATGWLSPEERDYVKQVLIDHPELHDLLISEREMIHLIKETPDLLDLSVLDPVDVRLKNVFERIDTNDKPAKQDNSNHSIITRISGAILSLLSESTRRQQYAAFAMITTLSIALLFAFVSPLLEQNNSFRPATAETPKNKSSNDKTILLVGLNTDHQNPKLLEVLSEIHAKLDAVPGKDGMYRVSLPKKLNSDQTKQILKKLNAYKDLFWFAGEAY